jgi:hypothetical protein
MVHTLYRVKALGSLLLETLKEMLSEEDYRKCASSPHIGKTWFKMTIDVFVAFLFRVGPKSHHLILHCKVYCLAVMFEFIVMLLVLCPLQQEIAEAADDAVRKYYDETAKKNRSDTAVTAVMRAAARPSNSPSEASLQSILLLPIQSSVTGFFKRLVHPN